MQEMQMPSGEIVREFFTEDEVRKGKANKRRRELEKQGAKFLRFTWVGRSKYTPHQGTKECERRRRQMERQSAKASA